MAKQKRIWDYNEYVESLGKKVKGKRRKNEATINSDLEKLVSQNASNEGKENIDLATGKQFLTVATKNHLRIILKDIPGFNPEYIQNQIDELKKAKGVNFDEQIEMLQLQLELVKVRSGQVSFSAGKEKFNDVYKGTETAKALKLEISDIKEKIDDLSLGRKTLNMKLDEMTDDHKIAVFLKEYNKYYKIFSSKVLIETFTDDDAVINYEITTVDGEIESITETDLARLKDEYTEICAEIGNFIYEKASKADLIKWGFTVNNGSDVADLNSIVKSIVNIDGKGEYTPKMIKKILLSLESEELRSTRLKLAMLLSEQKYAFETRLSINDAEVLLKDCDLTNEVQEKKIKDVLILSQVNAVQAFANRLKITQNIDDSEKLKDIIAEGLLWVSMFYENWKKDQKEAIERGDDIILSFNTYCGYTLYKRMEQYCLSINANGTMTGAKKSVRFNAYRNNIKAWMSKLKTENPTEFKNLDNSSKEIVDEAYQTSLLSDIKSYDYLIRLVNEYKKVSKDAEAVGKIDDGKRKAYLDEFYFKYGRTFHINFTDYVSDSDAKEITKISQNRDDSARTKFLLKCDILRDGGYVAGWKKSLNKAIINYNIFRESTLLKNTVSEAELKTYYNGAFEDEDYNPMDTVMNIGRDFTDQKQYDIDRNLIEDYEVLGNMFESLTRIYNIKISHQKDTTGDYTLSDTPLFTPKEIASILIMGSLVDTKKIIDYKLDKLNQKGADADYTLSGEKLTLLTGIKDIKDNVKNFFDKRKTYMKNLPEYGKIERTAPKADRKRILSDVANLKEFKDNLKSIGEKIIASPDSYYKGETYVELIGTSHDDGNPELLARLAFAKRVVDAMNEFDRKFPKKADKNVTNFVNSIIYLDGTKIKNI